MHIKKIEFKWFYFILFNLFRLKPIKTDFVLTTLATRCQTSDNVPHRSIKTKSARFSTGRDKKCKGRTKHERKEKIHSCHHWADLSMTLGGTGQRTIGWRRHGWALKLKLKHATIEHTRLWDSKCHQMQVIPLARNPREKRRKNRTPKKHKKKRKKHVTVSQFVPNHRHAIHVWKTVPRNHAVVICSDIFFHMFMVHVFTCLWFMLNGLEWFGYFP